VPQQVVLQQGRAQGWRGQLHRRYWGGLATRTDHRHCRRRARAQHAAPRRSLPVLAGLAQEPPPLVPPRGHLVHVRDRVHGPRVPGVQVHGLHAVGLRLLVRTVFLEPAQQAVNKECSQLG